LLARYREAYDLIQIGAYQRGSDPLTDLAIDLRPDLERFLRQDRDTAACFDETWSAVRALGARVAGELDGESAAEFDPELKEAA
jgi:flagellar biosynthesis/type III secretory pathway ATPase